MKNILWLASILIPALSAIAFRPSLAPVLSEADRSADADHMQDHLTRISTIKSSMVAGRLEDVQELAMWLAEHETVA